MTVTKVVTVVKTKKGPHTHKKKGELMENDQDAMEVSFFLTLSIWFMRKLRFVHESWVKKKKIKFLGINTVRFEF